MAKRPSLESILEAHQSWAAGQGGSRAVLIGSDLRGADLRAADLRGADLRRADFAGANLEGANLRRANLAEASFVNASLAIWGYQRWRHGPNPGDKIPSPVLAAR